MSEINNLNLPEGRPRLDGMFGLMGSPLRHIYMTAAVWRLASDFNSTPLNLLEVGSWCGASTLTWAHGIARYNEAGGKITCVDAWEPYIDTLTNEDKLSQQMQQALIDGQPFRVFKHNIQFVPDGIYVNTICGRSSNILPELSNSNYHLVYIDGDHTYESVIKDIENSLPLVLDGGVICGDDLELQACECDTSVVNKLPGIDHYYDAISGRLFHPGVSRAIWEIFGRVSAWHGFWAMRKRGASWEKLILQDIPFYCPPHITGKDIIRLKLDTLDLLNW